MVGAETLIVEVTKVGVVAAKMEYGVNVSDGVTVAARFSGADVTVGVKVNVGRISNVAEGIFCGSFCVAAVSTSSVFDWSAGMAQARLAANNIVSAKYFL